MHYAKTQQIIHELYRLGMSKTTLKEYLTRSGWIEKSDIKEYFRNLPVSTKSQELSKEEINKKLEIEYSKLLLTDFENVDDHKLLSSNCIENNTNQAVAYSLERYFQIENIEGFLIGVKMMLDKILTPVCESKDETLRNFLKELLGVATFYDSLDGNKVTNRFVCSCIFCVYRYFFVKLNYGSIQPTGDIKRDFLDYYFLHCIDAQDLLSKWDENATQVIDSVLQTLTPREEKIFRMYYLEGKKKKELAEDFEITQERIRQLLNKINRKLRHPSRSSILRRVFGKERSELFQKRIYSLLEPVKKEDEEPVLGELLNHLDQPIREVEENTLSFLLMSVTELDASVQLGNSLKSLTDVIYIGDLIQKTEHDILRTKKCGRKQLNELKELLDKKGLKLGLKFDKELERSFRQKLSKTI